MCNISVNVQPTEKVDLIILVALAAHHTPIFTAHCGLSVITWGEGVSTAGGRVKDVEICITTTRVICCGV